MRATFTGVYDQKLRQVREETELDIRTPATRQLWVEQLFHVVRLRHLLQHIWRIK